MKKLIALLLALAMVFSFVGCAETPDTVVVAQKDNERLIEAATSVGEDENRQPLTETKEAAPEHYSYQFASKDGKVKVTADADVFLPESDKIPMYRLHSTGFTQEQATAMFDYLFQEKETWVCDENGSYTKSMAQADILKAKQDLAELEVTEELDEGSRQAGIDGCEERIQQLTEIYDSLPDELVKIPVDSTFQTESTMTASGEAEFRKLEANTDDGAYLSIYNWSDLGNDGAYASYYTTSGERYTATAPLYQYPVTKAEAEAQCRCKYTFEEAKALADDFLRAVGVDNRLVQTYLLKGAVSTDLLGGMMARVDKDDEFTGYAFSYSRLIENTPVAVTTSNSIYHEDTNPIWLYERIEIGVNDDGICNVEWRFPVEMLEIVSDDVEILPFEDAKDIFEEMAPLIYQGKAADMEEGTDKQVEVTAEIDRVELDLMRVRDGGNLTGVYVPAWVFYGSESPAMSSADNAPWIVLAVNAVDGTIIDILAGY